VNPKQSGVEWGCLGGSDTVDATRQRSDVVCCSLLLDGPTRQEEEGRNFLES